ncbi:MAG: ABC transporter permease [Rubrobacteraceae bacterium]
MNNSVLLVARREVMEKVRDRAFILFTAFMLLLPVAGGIFGAFFAAPDDRSYSVGLVGEGSGQLGAVLEEQTTALNAEIRVEQIPNRDAARSGIEAGDADAVVVNLNQVLAEGRPGPELETLLQSSAGQVKSARSLQQAGVNPDQARNILDPEPLSFQSVGDEGGASEIGPEAIIAQFGMFFLFLTIFTYGAWIANGVVEEKSSRVIEVILSTIRPWRLMVGKITGIGFLALCQILLVLGAGLLAVSVTGLDLPPVAFGIFAAVLLWFVLGFAFYSCLFAVAGSLVSKQQDLQYTQLPLMVLIFIGYGAAFYEFGNPGSLAGQILSLIPPFSPMVTLMRMGVGEAGTLEVVAAVLLTLVATAGLVLLAARLYAGSALRFGTRVSLREAWKSSRNETTEQG